MKSLFDHHASYIQHWLTPLNDDKRVIFQAAADAQRIVDMVLNFHPDYALNVERPEPDVSACHTARALG